MKIIKIKLFILIIFINIVSANELNSKFQFNQSTIQAFYFVINANIYGEPLEVGEDWIVAYNGDICIGARQWAGSYTDIPVMGNDGSDYSKDYIKSGELPIFKIYDASRDILYDATPSEGKDRRKEWGELSDKMSALIEAVHQYYVAPSEMTYYPFDYIFTRI